MNIKQKQLSAFLFLLGIFISSIGSTTFIIGLMAFPLKMGVSAAIIGAAIGTARITGVLVNFFWGPIGDRVNPRKLILIGEIGALLCSVVVLATSIHLTNDNYLLFIIAVGARSIFTGIQSASIQKVGKAFDDEMGLSGHFAKYLNKATFGSIFFAMIISLIFLKYGSFSMIIIFDAITFLINGLLLLASVKPLQSEVSSEPKKINLLRVWTDNKNYFTQCQKLPHLDMLLAIAMMGANTLNVVLLIKHPNLIPYASGVFGLAVWLSTPIQNYLNLKKETLWLLLGASIGAQGFLIDNPVALLSCSFLRNISYWILYNYISTQIMKNSKAEMFASISSGRQATINMIGAVGEFWVGLKLTPVFIETVWRGILSVIGSFYNNRRVIFISVILSMMAISLKPKSSLAGEITVPLRSLDFNTDPQSMEDVASLLINRQLYRGLMKYTSELELVKDLAVSYEILESGKTYRFTLGDFKFSDGSPIMALDVVATFKRMLKLKSSIAADLQSIVGFSIENNKRAQNIGISAVSDRIVEFKLKYADPFFIKNIAAVDCSILKLNNKLEKMPVTSGRYSLIQSGKSIALQILPPSGAKSPHRVRFIKVDTKETAILMARQGMVDTLESFEVSGSEQRELEAQGWISFKGHVAKLLFFSLNPRMLDLKSRKILFSIFNQRKNSNFNAEHYSPSFGLIPNLLPGHLDQQDTAQLSTKSVASLRNKTVTISHPEGSEFLAAVEWAKSLLEKNGIQVRITSFPISDYFKVVKQKKYQMILRSKYLDYPDGMSLLTYFKSNLPINTFDAGNKKIDKLIERAQMETNNDKRISFYKKIQIELLKNYTLVPIFTGSTQSSLWHANKVRSIKAHPMGFHSIYFHEIELVE